MTGLFSYVNYLDKAVLACADQSGSLPVQNLAAQPMEQFFRSVSTATSITADLQSSLLSNVFGIFGANLGPTDTVRVMLSDVAIGGTDIYDSTVLASNIAVGYWQYVLPLPADLAAARYLQIDINAPSLEDDGGFDLSRAWLGPAFNLEIGFSEGWSEGFVDPSTMVRAPHSGRRFFSESPTYRTKKVSYDWMSDAEKALVMEMMRTVGIKGQLLYVPDTAGDLIKAPIFGLIDQLNDVGQPVAVFPAAFSAPFAINEEVRNF